MTKSKRYCVFYNYVNVSTPWIKIDPHFYCSTLKKAKNKIDHQKQTIVTKIKKKDGYRYQKTSGKLFSDLWAIDTITGEIYEYTYVGTNYTENGVDFRMANTRSIIKFIEMYLLELKDTAIKDKWVYFIY